MPSNLLLIANDPCLFAEAEWQEPLAGFYLTTVTGIAAVDAAS